MASPSQPQNDRSEIQECVELLRTISSALKSSLYFTLASYSQSNIAASAVPQQARLLILNDRVAYILRNLHQFPQVDQVVNQPMTFPEVERCILPILTQWSRSVTFHTYINGSRRLFSSTADLFPHGRAFSAAPGTQNALDTQGMGWICHPCTTRDCLVTTRK